MKKSLKRMVSLVCALAIVTAVGLTVFAGSWSVTNTSINSRGFNLSATATKYTSQLAASYSIATYDGHDYSGTMNTKAKAYYSGGTLGPDQGTATGSNKPKVTGSTSWMNAVGAPIAVIAYYGVNGSYPNQSPTVYF